MLIALLPLLQLFVERRLSLRACGILALAPLLWLYISWDATGNPFEYFDSRTRYVDGLLANFSYLASPSLERIEWDMSRLLYSANVTVMLGCFAGAWLTVKRLIGFKRQQVSEQLFRVLTTGAFYSSFLGFLILAYWSRNQPEIYERYGLIIFALGLVTYPTTLRKRNHSRLLLTMSVVFAAQTRVPVSFATKTPCKPYPAFRR